MRWSSLLLICILCASKCGELEDTHTTGEEIEEQINEQTIFYGTTVRIENKASEYLYYYHQSHSVSYGSGSGQQSVTGMQDDNDYNSLWTIKECMGSTMKKYDDLVHCGDCIRLEHMLTKKNLHSHNHQSPVSGNQEVSCYGDDGNGDNGQIILPYLIADNWLLQCVNDDNKGQTVMKAANWFQLQHQLTKKYLRASKRDYYNSRNCGSHCPIEGQLEISSVPIQSDETKWKIYSGLFYMLKKISPEDEGRHCNEYGTSCDDIESDSDEYQTIDYNKQSDL